MGDHARVIWLDDVIQFDFYDKPKPVLMALDAIVAHLSETFDERQDVAAVTTIVEDVTPSEISGTSCRSNSYTRTRSLLIAAR